MTVDLNTCVPGQKLELRNGEIVKYISRNTNQDRLYPHIVGGEKYTNDGYYYSSRKEDGADVVKIIPMAKPEQPKFDKHPSVAWWESCPWITDRKPTPLDGDINGGVYIKSTKRCTNRYRTIVSKAWNDTGTHEPWIHLYGWEPLKQIKQTPKEKALALIANHEDGWIPTPDQWNIIREGLAE